MITQQEILERSRGFKNIVEWKGGVDLDKSDADVPIDRRMLTLRKNSAKPFALYVGRISDEMNIKAFLDAEVDAIKVLVGPITSYAEDLQTQYRLRDNVEFLGGVNHEDLEKIYRGADVLVFPSRSDNFGLVNIESLACGIPVGGFESTCLRDIVQHQVTGILTTRESQLAQAIREGFDLAKLDYTKAACVARAAQFLILASAKQFASNLVKVNSRP